MSVTHADQEARLPRTSRTEGPVVLDARGVSQRFGSAEVLREVGLRVRAGEIHALLGPNGAGKTTLVRILAGLLQPTAGAVTVAGFRPSENARAFRRQIGLVASGDRTFYLRLSGLENLVFFARLHGMRRGEGIRRSLELLAEVGLDGAARRPVGEYSHGMQKRLAVARALLASPPVLLLDEATHDLDPEAGRRVRTLIEREAARGVAVAWVTQRLEEIRGFADVVTLLRAGEVRFTGSVPQLMAHAAPQRFVLHLRPAGDSDPSGHALAEALGDGVTLSRIDEPGSEHYVLALSGDLVLGDVLSALTASGSRVLSCHEERSEIEEAFVLLTEAGDR